MRIKKSFFDRDTNIVAKELLGKKIIRVLSDGKRVEAIITETEAYHGFEDKASHASRKKTERNKIMFGEAGLVYVYLVYGMHHCLNFVTMGKDFPAAVLIRAVILIESGIENKESRIKKKSKIHNSLFIIQNSFLINGPGKTCKALHIDRSLYGEDLATSDKIWLEDGQKINKCDIIEKERVGVGYAEECKDWKWNYRIVL